MAVEEAGRSWKTEFVTNRHDFVRAATKLATTYHYNKRLSGRARRKGKDKKKSQFNYSILPSSQSAVFLTLPLLF